MSQQNVVRPPYISTQDFVTAVTHSGDWQGYPSLLLERMEDPSLSQLQTSAYADKFNIDRCLEVERHDTGHVYYRDRATGLPPVFFATGFVTMSCVPPITFSTHLNRKAPHKWNQTVKITGLSNDAFTAYKQGYDNLANRLLDECTDAKYVSPPDYGDQYSVISASTPILTPTPHGVAPRPIPKEVDPYNILRAASEAGNFCFLEENEVLYQSILGQDASGCFQIEPTSPGRIRRGAMVELGFTFIAVPFNDKKGIGRKIECRLEQVLLVSDDVATNLNRPLKRATLSGALPPSSRKRGTIDLSGSYKRLKSNDAHGGHDGLSSGTDALEDVFMDRRSDDSFVETAAQPVSIGAADPKEPANADSITGQLDTMHVA